MKSAALTGVIVSLMLLVAPVKAADCASSSRPIQVLAAYPTANTLPENLLRFYLYFSHSMHRENILSSIYLTDAQGMRLTGIFLDNRYDLWSPNSKRLTLLFDPGRVKTGLVANQTWGRALQAGQRYTLVVDQTALDAKGCPLSQTFRKTFTATQADYDIPDPSQWEINTPTRGTQEPLVINLNGYMDHTSLAYRVRVKNHEDFVIAGRIDLQNHERQWLFYPRDPWGDKPYSLWIDPVLEDIAGNRVTGKFDQPSLATESANQNKHIQLPVHITPQ